MGFSGLSIGLSALIAQRRAVEVAGHNISNVATDGYSRQRVEMTANAGPITPALHSRYHGTGMGVLTGDIARMRDQFLELRGYQEHAASAHAAAVSTILERIEGFLAEPSDTALGAQLADFWAGWDDIANRPDDPAARAQLMALASTVVATFERLDDQFEAMGGDAVERLQALRHDVNATASRIAEINATIQNAVSSGLNANDLMDQRDRLIGQLAQQIGVTVRQGEAGTVDVFVGGTALVRGTRAETLELAGGAEVGFVWAKDGQPARVTGTAGGLIESVNETIPRYRAELGEVADHLRDEVNHWHQQGFGRDGVGGRDFFVDVPGTVLAINPDLLDDPDRIGASADPAAVNDGSVASELAKSAGADARYREAIVALAVEAQSAYRRQEIQDAITRQVDLARESEAGVNLDEEMSNLIAYQHAYSAAARFVAAVDEMLLTLVSLGR